MYQVSDVESPPDVRTDCPHDHIDEIRLSRLVPATRVCRDCGARDPLPAHVAATIQDRVWRPEVPYTDEELDRQW
jgi:hypothetical protein